MRFGFFHKRKFVVSAIQWNGMNTPEVLGWLGDEYGLIDDQPQKYFMVRTGHICIVADRGDWFVEEEGRLRIVKESEFAGKYESFEPPVQEPSQVETRQESTVSHD